MTNFINYGLVGYKGRLGSEIISVFDEKKHKLVYKFDIDGEIQNEIPQILIDSSLPAAFDNTVSTVMKYNIPLIIATTGLSAIQIEKLKEISKVLPVVQSFNFSVGVQILLNLVKIAHEKLPDWDVEIEETHHRFKKDKPSGTAKMIENIFGPKNINISSLRLGNVPGDHIVSFGGLGEVLSIKHSATSRRTFAEGILKSAEFIRGKGNGFYTFTDVVFGK